MSRTTNHKINEKTKNKKNGNSNSNVNSNVNVNGVPQKHAHYFQHNGYYGTNPNKIKKNGGGKGNWGTITSEIYANESSIDDLDQDDLEVNGFHDDDNDDATTSYDYSGGNRRGLSNNKKTKHSAVLYNKSNRRNSNHRLDEERLYDLEKYQV
ncbi:hypothetical protein ACO0RG_003946 [Hanseniaspora osmophila]|uniref:Hyaluronan/mRNA-binding protein domain-containing protein n=1 Tax=Hanseniaspora osmophila TaxID=56408 RepID=A0A1E5RAN1_9ASCO|nr:hypothetical protein AWRI3579_g2581 [Hanseniaspora osmophila]